MHIQSIWMQKGRFIIQAFTVAFIIEFIYPSKYYNNYRIPSHNNPRQNKNVAVFFKTNGTLKRANLIYQKIRQLSEFVIRLNIGHYKN